MRDAYHSDTPLAAEATLTALAAELDKTYPGVAASLRAGMDETLTILRFEYLSKNQVIPPSEG